MITEFKEKINGWKRIIGIGLIFFGYALKLVPNLESISDPIIAAGMIVAGYGAGDAIRKNRNK